MVQNGCVHVVLLQRGTCCLRSAFQLAELLERPEQLGPEAVIEDLGEVIVHVHDFLADFRVIPH